MFKTENYVEGVNVVHGFKIHISATSFNYKEIFQVVYPVLLEAGAPFKYIEKDEDVIANFSESEKPAESGKYITIYPSSRENCIALLELLYLTIPRDSSGIYLLSDRPYKDSQTIFYRYGFFEHRETDMVNGLPTLVGPNGEIWQDYQKTFFDLPSWIEDIQEEPTYQPSYLVEHYEIDQLLKRYLHTGNAGVIKSLLFRDNIEDQSLILDLTNALLVEFAQYSDYRKGLLGVADTLIEVYQKYGGLSILQFVERQLMTTGIKAKFDPSIQTSYVYLLSRFRRIKNEIVFEKQVI